jgi:hypothetical protein
MKRLGRSSPHNRVGLWLDSNGGRVASALHLLPAAAAEENVMAKIDELVQDFLAQTRIAVVGVSDQRDTGCNSAYRNFLEAGYQVFPVNPRISEFEGAACFPDLYSMPEAPEAVFILANPAVTDEIVDQCLDLGVKHVWMHCMMGTKPGLTPSMSSVSAEAVEKCRQHGVSVIPGSCPNQFLDSDFAHNLMAKLWRAFGFMKVEEGAAAGS